MNAMYLLVPAALLAFGCAAGAPDAGSPDEPMSPASRHREPEMPTREPRQREPPSRGPGRSESAPLLDPATKSQAAPPASPPLLPPDAATTHTLIDDTGNTVH
jgi:hypothetical protein